MYLLVCIVGCIVNTIVTKYGMNGFKGGKGRGPKQGGESSDVAFHFTQNLWFADDSPPRVTL